ncbi:hypothetical protein Ddye_027130 [Dipteronia dyeriana]|uniref:Uncharacterized protein n=1 Tax=Dipteronia dyeriana TaxID=168575 RepID=A0AAD9TNI6_9ROSI|nr:hypothetical protein Ddye_027130 [Dipteronia dyeriana]
MFKRFLTRRQQRRRNPVPRTAYGVFITFHTDQNPTRIMASWKRDSSIKIQLICTRGEGHDFGFHTIGLPRSNSHNDDKVSLKLKCPNCGSNGVVKIVNWCGPQTLIDSGTPTKIANIEISEFEPVPGPNQIVLLNTLQAVVNGEMSRPFILPSGVPTEVMNAEATTLLVKVNGTTVTYQRG